MEVMSVVNRNSIKDDIRERISCYEYCMTFGIELRGYHFKSLIDPGDSDRSASIHPKDNYWTDWKTNTHGDVIQLCMWHRFHENTPQAYGKAIAFLCNYLHIDSFVPDDYQKHYKAYSNKIEAYHRCITGEVYQYFNNRGFTKDYIDSLKIGYNTQNGRIVIPYNDGYNNYVYYVTRRNPEIDKQLSQYPKGSEAYKSLDKAQPKYMKDSIKDYKQHIIWGLHTLRGNRKANDTLVLAEGIVDAMSWDFDGYHVVSPVTGFFNGEQEAEFLTIAKGFKRIILTFDNDSSGTKFTKYMMEQLFKERVAFKIATIPFSDGKDVNDYFVRHHELKSLLDNSTDGIRHLVNSFDTWSELEKLIYSNARFMSEIEIADMIQKIDFEHYGMSVTEKMKSGLINKFKSSPTETQIIDEITRDYDLLFIDNDGFYIFEHGVWAKTTKVFVQKIIGKVLGQRFNTNSKKKAIYESMQSECVQNIEFNTQPVMTFLNGTLEIDTGVFRKSKPSDYCTIQQKYRYDEAATNEEFIKFIQEVTNNEPKRIALLQEMGGYILYPTNLYERCFMLMGSGSNGKSLFMEIIKLVYGDENCSAVPLISLNDHFSIIHLRHSLVNIDEETEFNICGHEKGLVRLASRDAKMRGCYKGKDYVEFVPRCKPIYLLNETLQAKDSTVGFSRRLTFIKFPLRFYQKDELPDESYTLEENERFADVHLFDRIKENPCGIFNWFYDGYKRLDTNKAFTESIDDADYKEDLTTLSNPIKSFIEWLYSKDPRTKDYGFISDEFESHTPGKDDWRAFSFLGVLQGEDYDRQYREKYNKLSHTDMYRLYCVWCKITKHQPMSQQRFTGKFKLETFRTFESYKSDGTNYYRIK